MQPCLVAVIWNLYLQATLAVANCAEFRRGPMQPLQMQKGLHHSHGLAQCQAEQILHGQAKLNGCIRELRASPAFAAGRGKPLHALVEPDGQRAS